MEKEETKRVIIFIAIAYGVTYLMGILMYLGSKRGLDLNVFPLVQMLYPATGVTIGMVVTNKEKKKLPMGFFITLWVSTGITFVMAILSVCAPMNLPKGMTVSGNTSMYYLFSQLVLYVASIVAFVFMCAEKKEKRKNAGMLRSKWKLSILLVLLYVVLYFGRILASAVVDGVMNGTLKDNIVQLFSVYQKPITWIAIATLPISYILSFLLFFGEEYGWRYYLQPILQKKFGLRLGVILLGIVWGLWHAPLDLFYYSNKAGVQMIVAQIITCVGLGIFFAYAYMKTQNIWVTVCMHFLNNNLIPIIQGNYASDVLQNQAATWKQDFISFVIAAIFFGFFLLAPVFRKKNEQSKTEEETTSIG